MTVPLRFVVFGVACAAWLGAMTLGAGSPAIEAAGRAWFVNWGIQIVVALTFWTRPFSLPARYFPSRMTRATRRTSSMFGVLLFARVARWISPMPFDRRLPHELGAALDAAETTHTMTFGIVTALTLACAVVGSASLTLFLALWNVLFNAYPIAIQRYNRMRLRRIVRRSTRTAPSQRLP